MLPSNAPEDYVCPVCLALDGAENDKTLMHQTDIFYKDDLVTGFINAFTLGDVIGNALLVPNRHFENIYEIPTEYSHRISELLQKTAIAMKQAYECDGITTLQCNEPAGGQHAFHYHHHIIQRYDDDNFFSKMAGKSLAAKADKASYAKKLNSALTS